MYVYYAVLIVFCLLLLFAALGMWRLNLSLRRLKRISDRDRSGMQFQVLELGIKVLGAVVAVTGILLTWSSSVQQQSKQTQSQLNAQYASALENLFSESVPSHIVGVKSLQGLARQKEEFYWEMTLLLSDLLQEWTAAGNSHDVSSFDVNMQDEDRASHVQRSIANRRDIVAALSALGDEQLADKYVGSEPRQFASDHSVNTLSMSEFRALKLNECKTWTRIEPYADTRLDSARRKRATDLPRVRYRPWIRFRSVDLSLGDFDSLALQGADFENATLLGTKLKGARLSKAVFYGARMDYAKLGAASMVEADLEQARLRRADLGETDLSSAWMFKVSLQGANLWHAKLDGAFLQLADLREIYIASGLSAKGANLWRADLRDAMIADGKELLAWCEHAQRRPPSSPLPALDQAKLDTIAIDLTSAYLAESSLEGAFLWNVQMSDVDLTGAILTNTTLINVDLTDAKGLADEQLMQAWFDPATIEQLPAYIGPATRQKLQARGLPFEQLIQRLSARAASDRIALNPGAQWWPLTIKRQ